MSKIIRDEILEFSNEMPKWQQILCAGILGLTEELKDRSVAISIAAETLLYESKLSTEAPIKIEINFPTRSGSSQASNSSKYINILSTLTSIAFLFSCIISILILS